MIHNHWTEHLPEAGTITEWGAQQTSRLRQIAVLQKQIRTIRTEFAADEKRIEAAALEDGWTADEIAEARANARDYPNRRAYLDARREGWNS